MLGLFGGGFDGRFEGGEVSGAFDHRHGADLRQFLAAQLQFAWLPKRHGGFLVRGRRFVTAKRGNIQQQVIAFRQARIEAPGSLHAKRASRQRGGGKPPHSQMVLGADRAAAFQAAVPVRRGRSRWKNFSGFTPTATFALGLNGSSGAEGPGMLVSMGGDLRTGAWPS